MKKYIALLVLFVLPVFASAAGDGLYQATSTLTSTYDPYAKVYISQEITAELSFAIEDTYLAMSNSIPGLTGGTATADTDFRVLTNNTAGYTVSIAFDDATNGMVGPNINSVQYYIPHYTGTGNTWTVGANLARFGWSTTSTTWWGGNNSNILYSAFPTAANQASSTLYFKVELTPNPVPAVATGWYYATATLTASMN